MKKITKDEIKIIAEEFSGYIDGILTTDKYSKYRTMEAVKRELYNQTIIYDDLAEVLTEVLGMDYDKAEDFVVYSGIMQDVMDSPEVESTIIYHLDVNQNRGKSKYLVAQDLHCGKVRAPKKMKGIKTSTWGKKSHRNELVYSIQNNVRKMF